MALVAFLYFQNEKTLYFDLTKSTMQNVVSKLSNEIIFAHMRGTNFNQNEYLVLGTTYFKYTGVS